MTTPTRPVVAGKRPDRATLVYTQRCHEAFKEVPVIIGGIEASLRRIAHYDYWQDKVRRSILVDSKADMLLYGNAERASSRSRTGWRGVNRLKRSPTCAARPSCAARTTQRARGWFELDRPRWTARAHR